MNNSKSSTRQSGRRCRRLATPVKVSLLLMIALTLTLGQQSASCAETWGEKLGYAPEQRVVIIHAGEMGMCYEASEAGRQCLEKGLVQSASAMAPCPWFGEFAEWCRANPQYDIGLSLTFNSEWKRYRWRPVSPRGDVASLIDPDGYFWSSPAPFGMNATSEEVEREAVAQIAAARRAGVQPSHLRVHLGALFLRPDLTEAYFRVAMKHWIPAVVVELTPAHVERFRKEGFALNEEMVELVRGYPLPKVDDLQFVPPADSYEEKRDLVLQLLSELQPGITQIIFHPAVESEALKKITDQWQQRTWEARLLADPKLQEHLQQQKLTLTNWKEIMRRFEGAPADSSDGQQP